MTETVFAAAHNLSKRFFGTQALDDVSIAFKAGSVHAVIGENGAGKSTLIKIFGGVHQPDSGTVEIDGKPCQFAGPPEAIAAGIVVIPQEMQTVPAQTVAENVLLGNIPSKRLFGILPVADKRAMAEKTSALLTRFNLTVDPNAPLQSLGFAERQLVMIARALNHDTRLLILDEPTAALEAGEVQRLFTVIKNLKAEGVAIGFVSHRLDEVREISDDCTILRDGRVVSHSAVDHAEKRVPEKSEMVFLMTGRDEEGSHGADERTQGDEMLRFNHPGPGLSETDTVTVRSGEIVGLAGLLGSGMTEFLSSVFGAGGKPATLNLKGYAKKIFSPADAIRQGIGLVPSERSLGLIMGLTVRENIVLPNLSNFQNAFGMNKAAIDDYVTGLMDIVDIRPRDPAKLVRELSGGNQQKVIFARWLARNIELLLLDEPTHGIDVGAKAQIHRLMDEFAATRGGVVFASSEMTEVLANSDTVLAMRGHEFVAQISRDGDYTERALRDALGG